MHHTIHVAIVSSIVSIICLLFMIRAYRQKSYLGMEIIMLLFVMFCPTAIITSFILPVEWEEQSLEITKTIFDKDVIQTVYLTEDADITFELDGAPVSTEDYEILFLQGFAIFGYQTTEVTRLHLKEKTNPGIKFITEN